jgi:hypothetical protein
MAQSVDDTSVAVIGYSCILPGGEHVEESWDMIMEGTDRKILLKLIHASRGNTLPFKYMFSHSPSVETYVSLGFVANRLNPRSSLFFVRLLFYYFLFFLRVISE